MAGVATVSEDEARHLRREWPAAVYAIGDIHGRLDLLLAVEERIIADAQAIDGPKLLVNLGDYVDRGPDSSGVIAHLMGVAPAGFERICLGGNHEFMMRRGLADAGLLPGWLANGGVEALQSYGLDADWVRAANLLEIFELGCSTVPRAHLEWVARRPLSLTVGDDLVMVHSGVVAAGGAAQTSERDILWARPDGAADRALSGPLVVHGHTPVDQPYVSPRRINIDTGAYASGTLTAIRLRRGEVPAFI